MEKKIVPWAILLLEVNIFLFYEITISPKYRAKYITQWTGLMHLVSFMGVLLQIRFITTYYGHEGGITI